jgi:ABC-type multidrug transport system fused ATPase/permease subunit
LEIGRHETLIARGGLYTSLVQQRELNPAARMVDEL